MTRAALVNGGVLAFLAVLVLVLALMLIAVIRLPKWTDTHSEDDGRPTPERWRPPGRSQALTPRIGPARAFARAPGPRPQRPGGPGPRTPSTVTPGPRQPARCRPAR